MSRVPGPYLEVGRIIRRSRLDQGISRRKLMRLVLQNTMLDATVTSVTFDIEDVENLGIVYSHEVIREIIRVLRITYDDIADQIAEANAANDAGIRLELRRAAKVITADQRRPVEEVQRGLNQLSKEYEKRPMT